MSTTEPSAIEDDLGDNDCKSAPALVLPSRRRLLLFAVLLPAAVAITNQLLFSGIANFHWPRMLLYPWMAFTTAVLSWCVGRYLQPMWLRLLVFAWCLVLLDLLTIAACLGGPVEHGVAYILIAAQAGMLVVWSVLANVNWQYRLPTALLAIAMLIAFAGIWGRMEWSVLVTVTTLLVAVVCGILSWRGFKLRRIHIEGDPDEGHLDVGALQFSIRHMLIWSAAIAPLLIVARGVEFMTFSSIVGNGALPGMLISLSLAITALTAIWSVLGSGPWLMRLIAVIVVPGLLARGLEVYTRYARPMSWGPWPRDAIIYVLSEMRGHWTMWLGLLAALLAALLLFLRANDYRLVRTIT